MSGGGWLLGASVCSREVLKDGVPALGNGNITKSFDQTILPKERDFSGPSGIDFNEFSNLAGSLGRQRSLSV